MARTARLLELLIKLQSRPRFTVAEMAETFRVSRRTMLRDLRALEGMGVPLTATPGPHGGYALLPGRRLLPLSLSMEEALGILLSHEAFLAYPQSPFAEAGLPAVTKLRTALPPAVVGELDRLRQHVAIIERRRCYAAPFLGELLHAALDGAHLRVLYDSRSGVSERVIFPFGLFASEGYWYCACQEEPRGRYLTLRADRVLALAREEGLPRPPHVPVADWIAITERDDGRGLPVRARLTPRGAKLADLRALGWEITLAADGGGLIEAALPPGDVEWFASQLLPLGTELTVESPPELITALRRQARAVAALYEE
jgi:predicted DNA-binding transcriptional regulator YafY